MKISAVLGLLCVSLLLAAHVRSGPMPNPVIKKLPAHVKFSNFLFAPPSPSAKSFTGTVAKVVDKPTVAPKKDAPKIAIGHPKKVIARIPKMSMHLSGKDTPKIVGHPSSPLGYASKPVAKAGSVNAHRDAPKSSSHASKPAPKTPSGYSQKDAPKGNGHSSKHAQKSGSGNVQRGTAKGASHASKSATHLAAAPTKDSLKAGHKALNSAKLTPKPAPIANAKSASKPAAKPASKPVARPSKPAPKAPKSAKN